MLVAKGIAPIFLDSASRFHLGGPLMRAVTSELLIPFDPNLAYIGYVDNSRLVSEPAMPLIWRMRCNA